MAEAAHSAESRVPRYLDSLLKPRSIAVVGASRRPDTIGYQILDNLLRNGFAGPVYPVNPNARVVHSMSTWPSLRALPEAPELAVIVVPKERVIAVVEECGEVGVRGVVVISAGFREVGGEGTARERELLAVVRGAGMRLVGPNCMGVLNTAPDVRMNATFAPTTPPRGEIAFMSQSGAMGVTILDYAYEYGIGISQFVSMGNKTDVSGNDLLEYWRDDPDVAVILMYLESFGNPHHFPQIARATTRRKPVIAVKAGRSRAGARAVSSHTGALVELDRATGALFRQCGVIRVDTVEELFEAAMAFANAPLPKGPRVAIVTNAGGPGVIIADACDARGLEVVQLGEGTRAALRERLPEEASVENPVDMIASARADDYRVALELVLLDPNVDGVIAAFVPPLGIEARDVARAIRTAAEGREKPVLAVLMGRKGLPQGMAELRSARIPGYIFPESAARALAATYRYRRWLERPVGTIAEFEADDETVEALIGGALSEGRDALDLDESLRLLAAYGIPVAPYRVARSTEEAITAATDLDGPVALKAATHLVGHKTEAGAVQVDVETGEGVREAYEEIVSRLSAAGVSSDRRVVVQRMVTGGVETIFGTTWEPNFGPLLMFGLGGIYVEVLRDVTFRLQPVSDVDAEEMIRAIRGFALLEEFRGRPAVHLPTLREVVQRLSQLVGRHREILEVDVNPFPAFPEAERCVAVDARVRVLSGAARQGLSAT